MNAFIHSLVCYEQQMGYCSLEWNWMAMSGPSWAGIVGGANMGIVGGANMMF